MRNKEEVISSIKQRILDEHGKHQALDWDGWAESAARKIYVAHIQIQEELLQIYYDSVAKGCYNK